MHLLLLPHSENLFLVYLQGSQQLFLQAKVHIARRFASTFEPLDVLNIPSGSDDGAIVPKQLVLLDFGQRNFGLHIANGHVVFVGKHPDPLLLLV